MAAACAPGGKLLYGTWQAPDTMDVQTTGLQIVIAMAENIFDPLIRLDPTDNTKYLPGLAESWEVSPDNKEFTFNLRKDVKFHDGTPFNAEAVKKTFERIMDPETGAFLTITALGPYESTEVDRRIHRQGQVQQALRRLHQPAHGASAGADLADRRGEVGA